MYNILNVAVKYSWQRYVMEAGCLTSFIPNISALNSKHFTYEIMDHALLDKLHEHTILNY